MKRNREGMKQTKISAFYVKRNVEEGPKKVKEKEIIVLASPKKEKQTRNEVYGEVEGFDLHGFDFEEDFSENTPPIALGNEQKKQKTTEGVLKAAGNVGDLEEAWLSEDLGLTFEKPRKCVVLKTAMTGTARFIYEQAVHLKDVETSVRGVCRLRDMWAFLTLCTNDVMTVSPVFCEGLWVVDAKSGYLSLFPDTLVSSTSLVGAMFCRRRGVLSHFFKGLDPGNKSMLVGQLVHETLQECLKIDNCSTEDIDKVVTDLLKSKSTLKEIYSGGMKIADVRLEMSTYIPRIAEFLDVYVKGQSKPTGKNFQGRITEVVDIEENITTLRLGLKGRIDVTVRVKEGNRERVMPLELKTGRASFSNEHKSQVALYTMMLSEVGEKVNSGLLFYLKDGVIEEVTQTETEKRDLIFLRNEFVRFIKGFNELRLPEPIRFPKACEKCPYVTTCTTFLRHSGLDNLSNNHPIRALVDEEGLKPHHVDYFIFWTKLVCLEQGEEVDEVSITNLKLQGSPVPFKREFKHDFLRQDGNATKIVSGLFVVLSNSTKKNVSAGKVISISEKHCSVLLDKNLEKYRDETFRMVLFQGSNLFTIYFTNLGCFLDESHANLREIIIDKRQPKFGDKVAKAMMGEECLKVLKPLNSEQRRAVLKVLTAEDYLLIRGPPGTGKTQTIIALVRVLRIMKKSVLIVSHTHSSVDNILLRLDQFGLEYVRLGAAKSVRESVHHRLAVNLLEDCESLEDVGRIYECGIIASTCYGVDATLKRNFDVCVVDESGQVLLPEVLKPLFCAKKFVLVGDSKQLGPVVRNREALKLGMDESLFESLENDHSTISLKKQYRMNRVIMALANDIAYDGELVCGSEEVAKACLGMKGGEWLGEVLSGRLEDSVVFVDTDGRGGEFGVTNSTELWIISKLVDGLREMGVEDIGVIAPYRAQVELLRSNIREVEVNTVDQFQGRDKEVIVYSCTRQSRSKASSEEFELLNSGRRLTVAVTRAKKKLIVVGDRQTMGLYGPVERLLGALGQGRVVQLIEGRSGFSWTGCNAP